MTVGLDDPVTWLGLAAFGLLAVALFCPLWALRRALGSEWLPPSRAARWAWAAAIGVAAALFLRPHEDALKGLDVSAFRHMARALAEGRPLHGQDRVLRDLPPQVREWVLFRRHLQERITRDLAFEVRDLRNTCRTQPFYYPLLPLSAVGFDLVVPGAARDYLAPIVGFLFAAGCLTASARVGGVTALCATVAVLFGSPLPVWLFRGFFPEALGSALTALVLLAWSIRPAGAALHPVLAFPLGLAVSFHPLLVLVALPVLLLVLTGTDGRPVSVLSAAFWFCFGLVPLVLMTCFVCQPYGHLSLSSLAYNFRVSTAHRMTVILALVLTTVAAGAVTVGRRCVAAVVQFLTSSAAGRSCLCLAWVLPTVLAAVLWRERAFVRAGLRDSVSGVGCWLGLGLLWTVVESVRRPETRRSLAPFTIFAVGLPLLAYLKGAEMVGLWNERRLLPGYLVLAVGALCVVAAKESVGHRGLKNAAHRGLRGVFPLFWLGAAVLNPIRWPAPYLVREERGADAWVAQMRSRIGGRLAVFDYFAHSVPFAVTGTDRVLGLTDRGYKGLPLLMDWLRGRAANEGTVIVTAYANPGMEDGVLLVSEGMVEATVPRVRSRRALPAVRADKSVSAELLRVTPIDPADPGPRVLNKILDGGMLALRGPWERTFRNVTSETGEKLPAGWTRQGSGFVGPVPKPGQAARVGITACAGRPDGQILLVTPPWSTNAVRLVFGAGLSTQTAMIRREAGAGDSAGPTGVYQLHAQSPYNPAERGIRGFASDLGVLAHSIRVEAGAD